MRPFTLPALAFLVSAVSAGSVGEEPEAARPAMGRWIVDRARTFALSGDTAPSVGEARYVLLWMRAASRVAPDLSDAYLWQYDLSHRLGDPDAAASALEAYCELVPSDVAARLNYIDLRFEQCQSVDARRSFCEAQLKGEGIPPAVVSDLHCRLAMLDRRVADRAGARRHAQAAVEAFPQNLKARSILLSLDDPPDPVERTRFLLDTIAANPARGQVVWELARHLDGLCLHEYATMAYQYLSLMLEQRDAGAQLPPEVLVDAAATWLDAGEPERAFELCNQAMKADPARMDAQVLMIDIARQRGMQEVAQSQREMVAERFIELEPVIEETRDAVTAAQAAWFFVEYVSDPARAVRLARLAVEVAPADPTARRVLGWAQLADGKPEEAKKTLAPLADEDSLSAIGLAKAQMRLGSKSEAVETLRQAAPRCRCGVAREKYTSLTNELGETPQEIPQPEWFAEVKAAMGDFDPGVLGFYDKPGEVLELTATVARESVGFGEPIRCRFVLSNEGTYPVTLGEDGMIAAPVVVVTASLVGAEGPPMDDYLSVSLMRRSVLLPGEQIEVVDTLDLGTLGMLLESSPQREVRVEFSFDFDPVISEEGDVTPRLKGVSPPPFTVTRRAVNATPTGLERIKAAARGAREWLRCRAVHAAAALVAEYRRSLEQPLDYSAYSIEPRPLERLVLGALDDESPIVRARAVDAMALLELDDDQINKAAPLLYDADPLVRLVTVDLFANAQGDVFLPVVKRLAEADPDPIVQDMAVLFRDAWIARADAERPESAQPTAEPAPTTTAPARE